jgi:DNA-binding transcriptional MerR regulator
MREAMKISELSRESGTPIPTIKYYLREGLLQPGARTAQNQADYGVEHVRRLHLVKALADIGGMPIATIRQVIAAIDDPSRSMHDVLGVAHYALARHLDCDLPTDALAGALDEIDRFLADLGWSISSEAPGRRELAEALVTLRRLGWRVDARAFGRYARSAERLAAWELTQTPAGIDRERTVESVVVGTVVFEAVFDALRRLAQEHHSAARFAG